MAFGAMLLAWGRHAPFYQILYQFPYFSTIRNPMKFMHPFHMALMILFAYGIEGLWRLYAGTAADKAGGLMARIKAAWAKASPFERKWTWAMFAVTALSFLLYLADATDVKDLSRQIASLQQIDPSMADRIAAFSVGEMGWYTLFLLLSALTVFAIQSRLFAGTKSAWAAVLIGIILVVDMARANKPWIKYFDHTKKYAPSAIIDILKDTTLEYRAATVPRYFRFNHPQYGPVLESMKGFFDVELLQQQFQYYNIPSLDIPQEPRMPEDKLAYLQALGSNLARLWELTSTRYIFGVTGGFVEFLNQTLDPVKNRFRMLAPFTLYEKERNSQYYGVILTNTGPYALIEFTGALPRAKLYARWQLLTNDATVLQTLADPAFDRGPVRRRRHRRRRTRGRWLLHVRRRHLDRLRHCFVLPPEPEYEHGQRGQPEQHLRHQQTSGNRHGCQTGLRRGPHERQQQQAPTLPVAVPLVEPFAQHLEAAAQVRTHRRRGHRAPPRGLARLQGVEEARKHRRPIGLRQREHGIDDFAALLLALEHLVRRRQGFVPCRRLLTRPAPPFVPRAPPRQVAEHAAEPPGHRRALARRMPHGRKPGFLHDVVDAVLVEHEALGEAMDEVLLAQQLVDAQGRRNTGHGLG
jgi:hypothetical protein